CMRTRSQSPNSNRQQQQVPPTFVEPFNLVEPIDNQAPPVVTMADNRTMVQLLEAPTKGYEDAIVVPEITADNFELKHGLLTLYMRTRSQSRNFNRQQQQVNQTFVEPFNLVEPIENQAPPLVTMDDTHTMAQLLEAPTVGYEDAIVVPEIIADNFELKHDSLNFSAGGNFLDKMPRDCLRIIESKSKVRNSHNKPVVAKVSASSSTPGISPDVAELKDMVKALVLDKKSQAPAPIKAVEESCVTCGGAHAYRNCPATDGNVYRNNIQEYVSQAAAANFNQGNTGYRAPIANQIRPPGFPPVQQNQGNNQNRYNQNRGNNYNQDLTYQPPVNQGQIYQPPINQTPVPQGQPYQAPAPQTQGVSKDDFQNYVKANDADIMPPTNNGSTKDVQPPVVQVQPHVPNSEPIVAPVSAPMPNPKPSIPMEECLALADLGASINLMPLSVWKMFSLPELTPTCMTLELADRSITQPIGIAEDVYLKVGKFKFPADFVVVDFDADPQVPLILERSFLKTGRALIDVYEGELTLRVGKEAVTFNLDQTSRYSSNHDDMTANRIDVIEMACEEYSQEVLGFSDVIASGNPTPIMTPSVSTSSFLRLFIPSGI
ncbi:reverse transcriptase domain-containing protein, partial [Tanacetum coccineum]